MVPHPPELWEQVKQLVIEGLAYKEIEKRTGISHKVISVKAANSKWTLAKAEKKAQAQLETLRPKLHAHLAQLTKQTRVPRTNSAKQLKPVADLVLTLANGAKLVEAWQDQQEQTLVNVLQISNSVTANPYNPPISADIDAQLIEPEQDYSI